MRVAIHAEGDDDELVLREIVSHYVKRRVEFVEPWKFRARGKVDVFKLLPNRLYALSGSQAADLLVVRADSDLTPIHPDHLTYPESSEAKWMNVDDGERRFHQKGLKRRLYDDRVSTATRHEILLSEIHKVLDIGGLDDHFPRGLAPFISKLKLMK